VANGVVYIISADGNPYAFLLASRPGASLPQVIKTDELKILAAHRHFALTFRVSQFHGSLADALDGSEQFSDLSAGREGLVGPAQFFDVDAR
jgi:hypothetical protein